MRTPAPRMMSALRTQQRTVVAAAAVVLLVASLLALRHTVVPNARRLAGGAGSGPSVSSADDGVRTDGAPAGASRSGARGGAAARPGTGAAVPGVPGAGGKRTALQGVTDSEIRVVYYWKGDRTQTSPYLRGSGQEGNLDEGQAFTHLIDYLNAHADGGATFMGFPFDLHGRRIVGMVLDAGQYPDTYAAAAEKIVKEIKPFAAVSSHGSLSAYICNRLAQAGIVNLATYDLAPGLLKRTNGYCLPQGLAWDSQVDVSVSYLTAQAATTTYRGVSGPEKRVYGVLYAEYPGLVDSGPALVQRMKRAGLTVGYAASIAADLATAQQQAPNIVARFRGAGVNTIVMPDAGAPLNFTHAAQAQAYTPDYFVWPCSGQDTSAMVRLFNAAQWERAAGLSCYDPRFNPDLTNDDTARRSEWYRQYQESAGNVEPPAQTSLVYQSLLPLVVGVTKAGRDLTLESFRAGMAAFEPYRYDAVKGRDAAPWNMLVTMGGSDGSQIGDVAKIQWSNTSSSSGNAAAGTYLYPENRRYTPGSRF